MTGFCIGAQADLELGMSYGLQATPCCSVFSSFSAQKKAPSLAPKNRFSLFLPLPLASYWKSSVTQMLPKLLQGQFPCHCWFAVASAVCPSSGHGSYYIITLLINDKIRQRRRNYRRPNVNVAPPGGSTGATSSPEWSQ